MQETRLDHTDNDVLRRFRRMRGFGALSEEQVAQAVAMARLRKYSPGETVIKSGELDNALFFLVSGELKAMADGVDVGTIDRMGDVFGEMGVIDGQPRCASVRAVTESLCVKLDASFFERLEGADRDQVHAETYRVFAEILADRLRLANEKNARLELELLRLRGSGERSTQELDLD